MYLQSHVKQVEYEHSSLVSDLCLYRDLCHTALVTVRAPNPFEEDAFSLGCALEYDGI